MHLILCFCSTLDPLVTWYDCVIFCMVWLVLHVFFDSSSLLLLLLCLFPPTPASCFPQCSANITTKMADAMEEYEKEAGCVPILHSEVWCLDFALCTGISTYTKRITSDCVWVAVCFSVLFRKLRCPLQNHWRGWQAANNAKGATASPLLLLHSQ